MVCRDVMQMKPREIFVNDRMQRGYRYLLIKPAGRCFHPEYRPELTPKQILELGVFGGKYMTNCCKPGDVVCSRGRRQVLVHWAYDSRRT